MADIYGNTYPNPNLVGADFVDSTHSGGRMRSSFVQLTVPDLDAGDKGFLFKIPSHARILPSSQIFWAAITGSTNVTIGSAGAVAAFAAAFSMAVAGNKSLIDAIANANYGQRVWEMLGLSSDPNTEIDIFVTFTDGTTNGADALVTALLEYVVD